MMFGTRDQIRIGAWWCMCCPLDLYEIEDEQGADDVRHWWDEGLMHGVWDTREAALHDMRDDVEMLRAAGDLE